jgi:hypothetical protein
VRASYLNLGSKLCVMLAVAASSWLGLGGEARSEQVELAQVTSAAYRAATFPQWDPAVLRDWHAREEKRGEGGLRGLVTLQLARDAWVSTLYYSASGRGYRMLNELLVPVRHRTTASYPLPPGDDGYTRLIVWESRPKDSVLELLLATPVLASGTRIPELLFEEWFPRSQPLAAQPWRDERQRIQLAPLQFLLSREPYAAARLRTDDVVEALNCSLTFRGQMLVDSDIWGSYGQWQLGLGNALQLTVPLRTGMGLRHAELRLQGQQPDTPHGQAGLQLDVNGWRSTEISLRAGESEMELLSFDVSHDLQPGLNTLSLRTTASGSNWLLRSIELWIE